MRKADYSKIAATYDRSRSPSPQNMQLWLGLIAKHAKAPRGARVLDLGCGTGRYTLPMATELGWRPTGADASEEMLAVAKAKDTEGLVAWDRQSAEALTYPNATFDVCYLSHLLHHVDSPPAVIAECLRVLVDGGAILIRYGSFEQIRDNVVARLFPETRAIAEERAPRTAKIEQWLHDAGADDITSSEVDQKTYATGSECLEAVRLKNVSVLTLIPQEAFDRGIRALEAYVAQHPDDPWLLHDRMTLTTGCKRRGPGRATSKEADR